jgi:hypothetical protein
LRILTAERTPVFRTNKLRAIKKHRKGTALQSTDVKTAPELKDEARDAEDLRVFVRNEVLRYAQNEFHGLPSIVQTAATTGPAPTRSAPTGTAPTGTTST